MMEAPMEGKGLQAETVTGTDEGVEEVESAEERWNRHPGSME
jgi:hypothetical protein